MLRTKNKLAVNFALLRRLSMMKNIKQAISQLKGVGKIVMPRRKRLSRYEQAMLDVKEGRVYEYDSVDDFFKEMGL